MSGDERFEALFRQEYLPVLRTVALITMDEETAAEVTQDAFTQLHLRWRRVSDYERPGAWVRRIAIREAVRRHRRAARGRTLETKTATSPVTVDEHLDVDVERAIAALSPQQRAAVALRYFDDLAMHQVADAMGCAEATARVHLHRARVRLAQLLGETVEEAGDVTR